jgi:translocator protein
LRQKNIIQLTGCLLFVFIAGAIGSYFTFPEINGWYSTLHKPFFNPPNWIFGPVWTTLYIFIAVSLYIIIKEKKTKQRDSAIALFIIQLILNTAWSIIFFGFRFPLAAFIEIIVLWILILLTLVYFYRINQITIYFLSPYLAWVSFATILNGAIVILN